MGTSKMHGIVFVVSDAQHTISLIEWLVPKGKYHEESEWADAVAHYKERQDRDLSDLDLIGSIYIDEGDSLSYAMPRWATTDNVLKREVIRYE